MDSGQGEYVLIRSSCRRVCDIMRLQGRQTFLAFLDVRKAYNTVWREGLRMKIREYMVQEECQCMQKLIRRS